MNLITFLECTNLPQTDMTEYETVTLDATAYMFVQGLTLFLVTIGVLLLGHATQESGWQQAYHSLAGLFIVVVILHSLHSFRRTYQKITLTPEHIILYTLAGGDIGDVLPLTDIASWHHAPLRERRSYGYLISFVMKDGRKYDMKCAAKYGPRIIAEVERRLG